MSFYPFVTKSVNSQIFSIPKKKKMEPRPSALPRLNKYIYSPSMKKITTYLPAMLKMTSLLWGGGEWEAEDHNSVPQTSFAFRLHCGPEFSSILFSWPEKCPSGPAWSVPFSIPLLSVPPWRERGAGHGENSPQPTV